VTDGTGAVLHDWTVTTGVSKPATEVPIINFWRFHNAPPATVSIVRIASFSWSPLDDKPRCDGKVGARSSIS
jgi:hypothetical protein